MASVCSRSTRAVINWPVLRRYSLVMPTDRLQVTGPQKQSKKPDKKERKFGLHGKISNLSLDVLTLLSLCQHRKVSLHSQLISG